MRSRRAPASAALVILLAAAPVSAQVTVPGNYPTIQAAINAVLVGTLPDHTVINVQPGTYAEAILIDTTSRSFTVRGVAGPTYTVVTAVGTGVPALRVFRAPGALRFEGLRFREGTGAQGTGGGFTFEDTSPVLENVVFENNIGTIDAGGGVLTRSHAQFSNCVIRANSAARFGGGMVITTGSRPTFTNCQIRDNISGTGGPGLGSIGSGGGVHANDASPTFRGCLITNNHSKFAGAGITIIGIYDSPYGVSRMVLEDTEVSNNHSTRFSAIDNPAEGGGIHIEDNTVAYLIRTRVIGNSANTGGGLTGYRARYEITSSSIEGNSAQDPLAVGGFGGGITLTSNNVTPPLRPASSLLMTDSVVRNNSSRTVAGVFVTGDQACGSPTNSCNPATAPRANVQIIESLIVGNAAGVSVGGIRLDRTDATVTNSHILNNTAGSPGQAYGGGLLIALGSNVTVTGTTIAGNAAANFGGGVFVDDNAVLNLTNSRIYRNTAGSGGGIYVGNIGAPSGTIQSSTIADNGAFQIHEQACGHLSPPILTYNDNVITPSQGQSDLYFSTCGGSQTLAQFNALPRTANNTSAVPSFRTFLATPNIGGTVLSWCVSRATNVAITGIGTFASDTGTVTASPAVPTTYTLTNTGGPGGSANVSVHTAQVWGAPTDSPLVGDFDGDGRRDLAVYRGSTGQWFIARSQAGFLGVTWGAPSLGDLPVPADYDGDGKADVAVFRQATGQWFVLPSAGGSTTVAWGAPALGDIPVAADYDGDNKADIAVFRRSTGQWIILNSSGGSQTTSWGAPWLGDSPVARDYDGDGRADIGVYRASTGQWFLLRSSLGSVVLTWGSPTLGDVPVAADYDGDGRADIAVARPTTGEWFVRRSTGGSTVTVWGFGDARLSGDYDGGGNDDIVIFRAASGSWLSQP